MLTETTGACTVTVALADFVVSAAVVAVTVKLPVVWPAAKRPVLEIVPPVALQVTAALLLPVTEALNCCVAPVCNVAVVGVMLTETTGACTVTVAVAFFVVSAAEVAVTVKLPAVCWAVKKSVVWVVAPVGPLVAAVLLLPVTVALKCCFAAVGSVAVAGEMLTDTTGAACTFTVAVAFFVVSAADVAVTVKLPAV